MPWARERARQPIVIPCGGSIDGSMNRIRQVGGFAIGAPAVLSGGKCDLSLPFLFSLFDTGTVDFSFAKANCNRERCLPLAFLERRLCSSANDSECFVASGKVCSSHLFIVFTSWAFGTSAWVLFFYQQMEVFVYSKIRLEVIRNIFCTV